jgi:hypothetical protein
LQKSNFNLASLAVIVVLLGLLVAMLFPATSASYIRASPAAVAARGKDIYVAIIGANTEREPLGLPPVWPRHNLPTNNAGDISQMNFTNSTDYFYALYDGENFGTADHNPYVKGFDYSKLAGAGVPTHYLGKCRLKPENNMWTIAKNVREEMEDIIPILVTRNIAAECLVTDLLTMSKRRIYFDEEWKTPFGDKAFVMVRKGGGTFYNTAKYARLDYVYSKQTFKTTLQGSQLPGLCYLTPSKEVVPSEAGCQTHVAAYEESHKWYRFVWLKEILEAIRPLLIYFLILSLIPAIFIFVRVFFDRQLKEPLSVLGPTYWILLWLAVASYFYCPVILFNIGSAVKIIILLFMLAFAALFQIAGCLFMVSWRRRTNLVETYRIAFGLMLLAPVLALQCLLTLAVIAILPVQDILIFGLVSGLLIRIRMSDKTKLTPPFSVMGPAYWFLLWLAVTAYTLCTAILFRRVGHLPLAPTLAFACLFHVLSCLYMVACNRKSGNQETLKTVLFAIAIAPVVACQSLILTVGLVLGFEFFHGLFVHY